MSWLHEGSDIPADPDWTTGILPNGVRYAVRRNATPPGTVAVRVRIDAGALMESDSQSGWAHLLEHMVFRGTKTRPDGEAVKLWQRLGASFGSGHQCVDHAARDDLPARPAEERRGLAR